MDRLIRKRKSKKKKVFYTMFYTYVGLLIMPIALICILSIFTLSLLFSTGIDSNKAAADQVAAIIDSHLENSFTYTATLITNNYATKLRYKQDYNGDDFLQMKELQSYVRQLTSKTYMVSEFFVIFNSSGYVVGRDGVYTMDEFLASVESNLRIKAGDFSDSLQFKGTQNSYAFPYKYNDKITKYTVCLVNKNIASESRNNAGVIVVAVLNPDHISSVLSSFVDEEGIDFMIKTQDGHLINTDVQEEKELKLDKLRDIDLADASDLLPFVKNTDFYREIPSYNNQWTYYYLVSSTGYITALRVIMLFSIILLVIGSLGGILFCYYLTRKQYSPLQMLVDRLIYVVDNNQSPDSNEFEMIERSLTNLMNQNRLANTKIDKYRSDLTNDILRNCILGYIKAGDTIESLNNDYGFGFGSDRFALIVYSVTDFPEILEEDGPAPVQSSLELIYSFISEVIANFKIEDCKRQTLLIRDDIVCLINPGNDMEEKDVVEIASKTAAYIKERFSILLLTGISSINTGIQGIADAYSECYEVIEYMTLLGYRDRIQAFMEMKQNLNIGSTVSLSDISLLEQQYLNCMKAADFKKALEIQDGIISLYFNQESGSIEQMKYRLHRMINTTISALEDIKDLFDETLYDSLHPYEQILGSQDIMGFRNTVSMIYSELSVNYDDKKEQLSSKRNSDMVEYVNNHFTNPELNIAMLSDIFSMSPAHLSRTFKKASGKGLLEYIHLLRIAKSKELMASSDHSMKTIAEEVGYTNSLTMIRAFHRYEGITPGEYKDAVISK